MEKSDWNARLLQIARENPNATGHTGELLREALRRQQDIEFRRALALAHAEACEGIVNALRHVLAAGSMLLEVQTRLDPEAMGELLSVACIESGTADSYMRLASQFPALAHRCRRRRRKGMLSPFEAGEVLSSGDNILPNEALLTLVHLMFDKTPEVTLEPK